MSKPKALAGLFGADEEEELPTLPPDEQLSLEDLDDDEEEEGDADILTSRAPRATSRKRRPRPSPAGVRRREVGAPADPQGPL